jgi:hypothetical protein
MDKPQMQDPKIAIAGIVERAYLYLSMPICCGMEQVII